MNQEHVLDQLPAYALDALNPEERQGVEEHVRACPTCQAELTAYLDALAALAQAVPAVEPPARLRQAVMEQVRPSRPSWPVALLSSARLAWSLAAVLLLVSLALGGALLLQSLQPEPATFRSVTLLGDAAAPDARGLMIISPDGSTGTLVVDDLPPLPEDRQYQLWLIQPDGERASGGVFSVDADGYGALVIEAPRPLAEYPRFGITVEPVGGSPGPTGPRVMAGEL